MAIKAKQLLFFLTATVMSVLIGAVANASLTPATKRAPTGFATFYGPGFDGRETASGQVFDRYAMVAAHPDYPFGTRVRVTNLQNGKTADVEIIDRGPATRPQAKG